MLNTPPPEKTITLGGKACKECGAVDETALLHGAVDERFQASLAKVLESIADPNTDPEKVRRITMTMTFVPDKERRHCGVFVDFAEKLPGIDGLTGDVYLGRHEGKLAVTQGARQEQLFETPAPAKPIVLEGGKSA